MAINTFPPALTPNPELVTDVISPGGTSLVFSPQVLTPGTYRVRAYGATGSATPIVTITFLKNNVALGSIVTADMDTGSTTNYSEIIAPMFGDYDEVRMATTALAYVSMSRLTRLPAETLNVLTFTSSASVTITKASTFLAFGGGGGGSGSGGWASAGGGGSGYMSTGVIQPGPVAVTVGAGGAMNGGAGGFSRVVSNGITFTANGGNPGQGGSTNAPGGNGGSGGGGGPGQGGFGGGNGTGSKPGIGSGQAPSAALQLDLGIAISNSNPGFTGAGGFYGGGSSGSGGSDNTAGQAASAVAAGGGGANGPSVYRDGGAGGPGRVYIIDKVY
jgi:hypothetical protein